MRPRAVSVRARPASEGPWSRTSRSAAPYRAKASSGSPRSHARSPSRASEAARSVSDCASATASRAAASASSRQPRSRYDCAALPRTTAPAWSSSRLSIAFWAAL
ncbi:hypothetical protein STANM309S_06680 [Streptomyces tanashiensis]